MAGTKTSKRSALGEGLPFSRPCCFRAVQASHILSPVANISFGTDGWRGIIAEDFTVANVRKVATAIARYAIRAENSRNGVLVGYDSRFGGPLFARAAAEAISAAGIDVWLSDAPCPSPALSLLVCKRQAAGGVMITASHNPPKWSGMKYKASYGSSALPSIVAEIEADLGRVLANGSRALPPRKDLIHSLHVRAPYLETLSKLIDWNLLRKANLRFLADPMHGAACGLFRELCARNGVACDEIRGNYDPLFGGVNPEPIEPHISALQQAVRKGKYDAGFAADGDGDRIGAVDADGTFITPHQIFAILLWHLAGSRKEPGNVAKTFSTTKLIDKIARKFNREIFETPIGFKHICALMLERDILLGGEESGGFATKMYLPERDATVTALLLAEVMAWHGKRLGELVKMLHNEFGVHHYGRVDLELHPGQKERAIQHFGSRVEKLLEWRVEGREDMDGQKLYLGDARWLLVRASGTERMLRVYAETANPHTTQRLLDEVCAEVQKL